MCRKTLPYHLISKINFYESEKKNFHDIKENFHRSWHFGRLGRLLFILHFKSMPSYICTRKGWALCNLNQYTYMKNGKLSLAYQFYGCSSYEDVNEPELCFSLAWI